MESFLKGRQSRDDSPELAKASEMRALVSKKHSKAGPDIVQAASDCAEDGDPPKVELVMERGEVRRILITCTCGKRIEIECEY